MRRPHGPRSLRARLFIGIAATLAVSTVVMLAVGAALTRRSLDHDSRSALDRQVELIVAQHAANPLPAGETTLGRFLATEQERLAILTPAAGGAAPARAKAADELRSHRARRRHRRRARRAVHVRGPPRRRRRDRAAPLDPQPVGRLAAVPRRARRSPRCSAPSSRRSSPSCSRAPSRAPSPASPRRAGGSRRARAPTTLPIEGSTELRQLSTAFNELSEELHRAQDAERAFLLSVSHELKTPLTAIRGHAEGLADGVIAPERAGEVIEREAHRLERLIRDLLDLARLRRRTFDVTPDGDRPRRGRERGDRPAHAPGAGLRRQPRAPDRAAGRRDRRRRPRLQALSNLVENAIRCTPRAARSRSSRPQGRLAVHRRRPGPRGRRPRRARSSASTSGTATAPTAPSAPGSGSRSSPSSRRRWAAASTSRARPARGRRSRSSSQPAPGSRVTRLTHGLRSAERRRTRTGHSVRVLITAPPGGP